MLKNNNKKYYIGISLFLIILLGAIFINKFYKENFDNSIPSFTTQMIINIPEFNDNFNSNELSLDYIFNWGLENKINVGLFYDADTTKEYVFIGDIKFENKKWWQPSGKKFIFSNQKIENVMSEGNKALNAFGYNIEYSNSKNYQDFVNHIEKNK